MIYPRKLTCLGVKIVTFGLYKELILQKTLQNLAGMGNVDSHASGPKRRTLGDDVEVHQDQFLSNYLSNPIPP